MIGSSRRCALLWVLATRLVGQAPVLELRVDATTVGFGERFGITVARHWSIGDTPMPWDDRWLTPLTLRPLETMTRDVGSRREETRRFDAFAFRTGAIILPAAPAVAADGVVHLQVDSSLPPGDLGTAELPGDLMLPPFPMLPWLLGGGGILGVAIVLARVRRAHAVPPTAAVAITTPLESPLARARRRLDVLRTQMPADATQIDAFHVEASAVLREYLEERFAVRAPEMTTEEFLGASATARALAARHLTLLGEFLAHCDLVKFAGLVPTAADLERLLGSADTFLDETAGGGRGDA